MGTIKISQLTNQFVKDLANQCDIVQKDGELKGKEITIFKDRTKQAIDCNLIEKKDLVSDLWQILGMNVDSKKADSAKNIGKNVYEMLEGYTFKSEYYAVTKYIENLDTSNMADFFYGYQTRLSDYYTEEGNEAPPLHICEQIATEYFYSDKESVLQTLCKKVIAMTDLFGDKNSPEYKTLVDIVQNQNIVRSAKRGVLDKCISVLVKTFKADENIDSLFGKIEKK